MIIPTICGCGHEFCIDTSCQCECCKFLTGCRAHVRTIDTQKDLKLVSTLIPTRLDKDTEDLLQRFITALGEKLVTAERKYGFTNEWVNNDWMNECRTKLREHLEKGDPLDVAIYCAFLWHHYEPTVKGDES